MSQRNRSAKLHVRGRASAQEMLVPCLPLATLVLLLLALAVSPALAETAHSFAKSFGAPGEGAGQLSLVRAESKFPGVGGSGVAVNNETHDVYVADTGNNRIDVFEANGTFLRAWGWGVADGISEELQTCTLTCFKGFSGTSPGQLEAPTFIAVDNDPSSPSHGAVYVTDAGLNLESPQNLVTKFSVAGKLEDTWGVNGQLNGPAGEPTEQFGAPAGVAVDGSGNLWVYVGGTFQSPALYMYEFEQDGTPVRRWRPEAEGNASPHGLGVDAAANLYVTENASTVQKLSSAGSFIGTVSRRERESDPFIAGLAVDPATPDIYVGFGGSITHFASSCKPKGFRPCVPAESFGPPQLAGGAGLAVDPSSAAVYAANTTANQVDVFGVSLEASTGPASNVLAKTATVSGSVNPMGSPVTECRFEYGETEDYGRSAACEAPAAGEIGSGQSPVAVHANLAGLQGGTTYHYRLLVANEPTGRLGAEDRQLSTPPTPLIANAAASNVTPSSADLSATINPLGVPVTSCTFEYGTTTSYGSSAPCAQSEAQIGSASTPVPVSASLSGLAPNTEYHWRLVAANANGSSEGTLGSADHTFVYSTTGGALPDGRAYEMVTPPAKNCASIAHVAIGARYDFSEDGSRLIAPSIQCFAAAQGCTGDRQQEGEPYEFTRSASGWMASALAPPASAFRANSAWEVGADEGVALFSMPTELGGPDSFFAREPGGAFLEIGPATPPGTTGVGPFINEFKHGTQDLSHFVYETGAPAWPFDQTIATGESIYEYSGIGNSEPFLVAVTGGQGSNELVGICGSQLPRFNPTILSADGRMVYFGVHVCPKGTGANGATEVPAAELYARVDGELSDAHTVAISEPNAPQALASTPADEACTTSACQKDITEEANWRDATFRFASTDGSKVFFESSQQLTDQANQDSNNLYEYDFHQPAGHNLLDLSAGDASGSGPQVEGVVAASADGSHVYFVARGVLASLPNSQGQTAEAAANNLYVYERDGGYPDGHTAFIAALPDSDSSDWKEPLPNVTPDGRFLVFQSHGRLTADVARSGGSQVFRYDAQTEQLVRISVGDMGFNDNGNAGTGDATIAFGGNGGERAGSPRWNRTMSNDGAYVFFRSPIALTPHALNDVSIGAFQGNIELAQNLYEYHDGRVYLISDGRDLANAGTPCPTDSSAVCLLGTDATGSNVFFTTTAQLVPADTDTQLDIYDARICTTASPCIAPAAPPLPPCLGEACHGIPAATPSPLSPGTASFNGEGNLVPSAPAIVKSKPLTKAQKLAVALKRCRKLKPRGKRIACQKQARKRYGPRLRPNKAKRATNKRRASR
jgi:DNA-binding beta-propeller fold protein YncE